MDEGKGKIGDGDREVDKIGDSEGESDYVTPKLSRRFRKLELRREEERRREEEKRKRKDITPEDVENEGNKRRNLFEVEERVKNMAFGNSSKTKRSPVKVLNSEKKEEEGGELKTMLRMILEKQEEMVDGIKEEIRKRDEEIKRSIGKEWENWREEMEERKREKEQEKKKEGKKK